MTFVWYSKLYLKATVSKYVIDSKALLVANLDLLMFGMVGWLFVLLLSRSNGAMWSAVRYNRRHSFKFPFRWWTRPVL